MDWLLYDNGPRHERVNVDINPTGVFFSPFKYLLELKQFGMVGNSSHNVDYSTSYALYSYRLYSYFRIASNSLFQPMFITFQFYVYFPTLCINPLTTNVPIIKKPISWFALQINWLVCLWWGHWRVSLWQWQWHWKFAYEKY